MPFDNIFMRFKKIALVVLSLVLLPFIILGVNRLTGVFYDRYYTAIDKVPSSAHYILTKVKTEGVLVEQTAFGTEIDSMWVDTIPLTKTGQPDTSQKPAKVYKTYSGNIYLDTLNNTIKVETTVRLPAKKEYGQGVDQNYFYTINTKGKVIAAVINKDSTLLKNCLLLKDEIRTFQPWPDSNQPVYLNHFTREEFSSDCLDPLRDWGNPTGNNLCYMWSGTGYYKLKFHNETLQFKLPCASKALFFSSPRDFMTVLGYYQVPARFSHQFDVAFIVYDDTIYLARTSSI
jgi:hypothetical protein